MTVIDKPAAFFRTPRHFAAAVLGNEVPEDLQPDISNLIGWAKNFFLQYFSEEHDMEITAFDGLNRRRVRAVEARLRERGPVPDLLLVSHFVTMCQSLDEQRDTSGELDRERAQEEVLAAIDELLKRIVGWAASQNRPNLLEEATRAHDEFSRAVVELG